MSLRAALFVLAGLAGVAVAAGSSGDVAELRVQLEAPELFVPGDRFVAEVELEAVGADVELATWRLTPSILEVDGVPLGSRADVHELVLADGDSLVLRFDLGLRVQALADFELSCAGSSAPPIEVNFLERAPGDLDFMGMPADELDDYRVVLRTNRGDMLLEMWPRLAPNHVRNFLDLAQSGFYDGTTFHRVMPGFMIQGGDPTGTGGGNGPRMLEAEFSQEKHVRGVLSMARTDDPNSASCQFFVMHGDAPGLDGQYSIFGRLVVGFDTLDAIANAPGRYISQAGDIRPAQDQVIERALVVLAD
jgi:cyclophilin family peptidyl-prolyl cis-trans isomerase